MTTETHLIDKEKAREIFEKFSDKSEDELIAELALSIMKSNPSAIKDILSADRKEKGLPDATEDDITDMLNHADDIRQMAKEGKFKD